MGKLYFGQNRKKCSTSSVSFQPSPLALFYRFQNYFGTKESVVKIMCRHGQINIRDILFMYNLQL